MPRYIDADALLDRIPNLYERRAVARWVDEQPTTDVREVKHEKWILDKPLAYIDTYYYHCSECGNTRCFIGDYKAKWCEECGAKMDGEQNVLGK